MLLALDESLEGKKPCVGLLGISWEEYYLFEKDVISYRRKNFLWGEISWKKLKDGNGYLEKYKGFVDLFLKYESMRFFCWPFDTPERKLLNLFFEGNKNLPLHKCAYGLVRSTSRKMLNAGQREPIYLIPDAGSPQGQQEWKKTRELLEKDPRMPLAIEACCQAGSAVSSLIQMVDLLTGCAHDEVNESFSCENKRILHDYLVGKVGENFFLGISRPLAPYGTYKWDCMQIVHSSPSRRVVFPLDTPPF